MNAITPPPGSRLIDANELAAILAAHAHPDDGAGPAEMDEALLHLVRTGEIVAARFPDGRLAFSKADQPTNPTEI